MLEAIPSFGILTACDSRRELADGEFLIAFRDSLQTIENGQISRFASAKTFPALGPDIQIEMNKIALFSKKVYPAHSHPRGSEMLFVLKGEVDVVLALERKQEEVEWSRTSSLQGLPHSQKGVRRKIYNVFGFL